MNSLLLHYHDVLASSQLRIRNFQLREHECLGVYGLEHRERELLLHLATGTAEPQEGSISVFGKDTRDLNEPSWFELVTRIGSYDLSRLNEEVSIGMNLASGLIHGNKRYHEPKLSMRVLATANVLEITILELAASFLSADPVLRMKAGLGSVISRDPRLLFFDDREQDPEVRKILPRIFRRVRKKCKLAIVLFTSDQRLLQETADKAVFLNMEDGVCIEKRIRGWYHTLFPFLPLSLLRRRDLAHEAARHDQQKQLRLSRRT